MLQAGPDLLEIERAQPEGWRLLSGWARTGRLAAPKELTGRCEESSLPWAGLSVRLAGQVAAPLLRAQVAAGELARGAAPGLCVQPPRQQLLGRGSDDDPAVATEARGPAEEATGLQ